MQIALFASLPAQLACVADCGASQFGLPIKEMFWCMGCNGSTYPLTGNVSHEQTPVQSALLTAERIAFKLHRQLIAWGTSGAEAQCQKYPMPIMDKRQYRWQMVNPRPHTKGRFTCPPTGSSTIVYERFKSIPVVGEDLGWLVWRKRNCCAL